VKENQFPQIPGWKARGDAVWYSQLSARRRSLGKPWRRRGRL